jgi:predicted RNA binding protein YcfA (HicA-like mRNA interferase family)
MRGYSSREPIQIIEADGWRQVRSKGSHRQFKHPTKPGLVTVPHPEHTMKGGTVRSIFRQAGIEPPG